MFEKVKKKSQLNRVSPNSIQSKLDTKVSRSLDNWSQSQGIDLSPSRRFLRNATFFSNQKRKITIGARNIKMRRSTFRHFMRSYLVHILLFSAVRALKRCLLYRSAYVTSNSMQILYSTPNNTHRHYVMRLTF